jgi:hypothetical protein
MALLHKALDATRYGVRQLFEATHVSHTKTSGLPSVKMALNGHLGDAFPSDLCSGINISMGASICILNTKLSGSFVVLPNALSADYIDCNYKIRPSCSDVSS